MPAETYTIVPNVRTTSQSMKEKGSSFLCPTNTVMTGRHHSGDENGQTYYGSATIFIVVGASTDPAPAGTIIVPNIRTEGGSIKESTSSFVCPAETVMTGRSHTGDENDLTQYEYATLKAIDPQGRIIIGEITITDIRWEKALEESSGKGYDAPLNRVIVGRQHTGDENTSTQYATAIIKFNGHATEIINYTTSEAKKESGGWNWFKTGANQVVTGRHHFGDEEGNTYYCMGTVSCDITVKPKERFKVVVLLYPGEDNCPMNPLDFIRLSRFRQHNANGSDDGYNKNTEQFVNNNDHSSEYYDIPVSVINSYLVIDPRYALYNLRPRDKNSIGSGEVFLEPDDNLHGDFDPNGRVPVYTYSTYYTSPTNVDGERKEFWVFYGYDLSKILIGAISISHQGDWERIILDIVYNNIQGAWLSQHADLIYYPASQLNIAELNGVQTLTVYSAIGTHAHYPSAGSFPTPNSVGEIGKDHTADGGYQWVITDNCQLLASQPWRDYAGAWGEIGAFIENTGDLNLDGSATTGPLGPWYKQLDFGTQNDDNISLSSIISSGQILIIPDIRAESDEISESGGTAFETPADTLITGRQHKGDENGKTKYEYATLEAIDYTGTIVDGAISIVDRQWSDWHKESDSGSFFQGPQGRVLTGRQHAGDEQNNTRYQTAVVLFNGNPTSVVSASSLLPDVSVKESGGTFYRSASRFILVGRTHTGDENGETTYYQGYICQR